MTTPAGLLPVSALRRQPTYYYDKARKRHLVKWAVSAGKTGGDRTRSFPKKAQAENFARRLKDAAKLEVTLWREADGEPHTWHLEAVPTVLEVARIVLRERWASWSSGNRRTRSECWSALLRMPALTTTSAGAPNRDDAHFWLRYHWLRPVGEELEATPAQTAAGRWLLRNSLPVSRLNGDVAHRALSEAKVAAVTQDAFGASVQSQQRQSLSLIGAWSASKGHLVANPVREAMESKGGRRRKKATGPSGLAGGGDGVVDARLVPSPDQCRAFVVMLSTYSWTSWQWVPFVDLLWQDGLRPSEAAGVLMEPDSLILPPGDGEWGRLLVHRATHATGGLWVDEGEMYEESEQTKTDRSRWVDLTPETVVSIREYLDRRPRRRGEHLLVNSRGKPYDPSAVRKAFAPIRHQLWKGTPLASGTTYHFRHAHASALIAARRPLPEIAARLGHGVPTLVRKYAQMLDTDPGERMLAWSRALTPLSPAEQIADLEAQLMQLRAGDGKG